MTIVNTGEGKEENGVVQLACTVFKNYILSNKGETQAWTQIDAQTRKHAKDAFFKLISSPNQIKTRSACICIAAIASAELPLGLWDEFVEIITNCATGQSSNVDYRFAALYILENLGDFYGEDASFTQQQISAILYCAVTNISRSERKDLVLSATKALLSII